MSPDRQLTAEIRAELSGKTIEDRRDALTRLHQQGYTVRPYLLELLACQDGVHCDPGDKGFNHTTYAGYNLWVYNLKGGEIFFYEEVDKGTFKHWPASGF